MSFEYIDRNVAEVVEKIEIAKQRAGRKDDDVMLLAAVKYAEPCEIEYLIDLASELKAQNDKIIIIFEG